MVLTVFQQRVLYFLSEKGGHATEDEVRKHFAEKRTTFFLRLDLEELMKKKLVEVKGSEVWVTQKGKDLQRRIPKEPLVNLVLPD